MTGIARSLLLAGAACAGLTLGGCGLKGDPTLPDDKADTFPRAYPDGATQPDVYRPIFPPSALR